MKKYVAALLIAAVVFSGCEPAATFDQPQPAGVKTLPALPQHLQGKYISEDQASIITITDNIITRHFDYDFKTPKDSLDSSYKLQGDLLIHLSDSSTEKVVLKGDTIFRHEEWTDTLGILSDDFVVKKFKGYYFLNTRYKENNWEVKKLWLKKGILTIGYLEDSTDIQKLREITETPADTTSVRFTPTRRQFKQFVNQDGFGIEEKFIRMGL